MTAEADIAAIDDGGANTAAEVRTALTSTLARADAGFQSTFAYRHTNQTIATNTTTVVDLTAAAWDDGGWFDNTNNQLNVPEGTYLVVAQVRYETSPGYSYMYVVTSNDLNPGGPDYPIEQSGGLSGNPSGWSAPIFIRIGAGGGLLQLQVRHTAGSNRTLQIGELSALKVS